VIYLIGGPPRCGKTTVARRLAAQLGCAWVQTDHLGAALSRYIPEAEYGLLRPGVEAQALDNDVRYATFSAAEVVDHYRGRAEMMWPGLRAFLEYAASDGEDMVVEGYHLEPALLQRLSDDTRAAVRSLFLYRTNLEETTAAIRQGSHGNDWVIRRTAREATFRRIALMIVRYSTAIEGAAERHGCLSLAMDGPFQEQVEAALIVLTSGVRGD
jgi:2-phosphoglycerate kinase